MNLQALSDENKLPVPFDLVELFEVELGQEEREKRCATFESLYTHSLFYFAQVYGKLDDKQKSATLIQHTLQRLLDNNREKSDNEGGEKKQQQQQQNAGYQERVVFNPLDWATHAAALSQYYVCEGDFATARHCLCCAEAILNRLNLNAQTSHESDRLNEQTASIKRCWGKYAIELLKTSKQKLIDDSVSPPPPLFSPFFCFVSFKLIIAFLLRSTRRI